MWGYETIKYIDRSKLNDISDSSISQLYESLPTIPLIRGLFNFQAL